MEPLHRVMVHHHSHLRHMEPHQYHPGHTAVPELEVSEYHLPAMAHQQHRQVDRQRHPEAMVLPSLLPPHLPATEHPLYLHPTMLLPASPLDHLAVERLLKVTEPLHPVHLVEEPLLKPMVPLVARGLLEVAHHHRVTGHLPDRQTATVLLAQLLPLITVLPVFLFHRLKATVPPQDQLTPTALLQNLHRLTEHQVLHLVPLELHLKTTARLPDLRVVTVLRRPGIMEHQRVGRQGHQDFSAHQVGRLKEVHRQEVTGYQQPQGKTTPVMGVMYINFVGFVVRQIYSIPS